MVSINVNQLLIAFALCASVSITNTHSNGIVSFTFNLLFSFNFFCFIFIWNLLALDIVLSVCFCSLLLLFFETLIYHRSKTLWHVTDEQTKSTKTHTRRENERDTTLTHAYAIDSVCIKMHRYQLQVLFSWKVEYLWMHLYLNIKKDRSGYLAVSFVLFSFFFYQFSSLHLKFIALIFCHVQFFFGWISMFEFFCWWFLWTLAGFFPIWYCIRAMCVHVCDACFVSETPYIHTNTHTHTYYVYLTKNLFKTFYGFISCVSNAHAHTAWATR